MVIWQAKTFFGNKLDSLSFHQRIFLTAREILVCPPAAAKVRFTTLVALVLSHGAHNIPRAEYFEGFTQRHPVFSPYSTPIYSNAAYRLLGYVLERLSGKPYHDLIETSVLRSLDLNHSGTKRPTAIKVPVIPNGDSGWFQDVGDEAP